MHAFAIVRDSLENEPRSYNHMNKQYSLKVFSLLKRQIRGAYLPNQSFPYLSETKKPRQGTKIMLMCHQPHYEIRLQQQNLWVMDICFNNCFLFHKSQKKNFDTMFLGHSLYLKVEHYFGGRKKVMLSLLKRQIVHFKNKKGHPRQGVSKAILVINRLVQQRQNTMERSSRISKIH